MKSAFFFALNFFSPVAGATVMLPQGVPFESLIIYIYPNKHFFDLKFSNEIGRFFRPQFFILTDGMGWMGWDGMGWWVSQLVFLAHIVKTT